MKEAALTEGRNRGGPNAQIEQLQRNRGAIGMADQTVGRERRAFPRVPTGVGVEIVRPETFCIIPSSGRVLDISQNGALLQTEEQLELGEWILLRPEYSRGRESDEITAVVDRKVEAGPAGGKFACRFPIPIDYGRLQAFL